VRSTPHPRVTKGKPVHKPEGRPTVEEDLPNGSVVNPF
jgi:hypothetical protein